jgi:hypothetical protein
MSAFFTRCKREMVTLVFTYYVDILVFPHNAGARDGEREKKIKEPTDEQEQR